MGFGTTYPPEEDFKNYTPVMQQYLRARSGMDAGSVLFFRMGDFYEAFFDDAKLLAKELEITLTGRSETNYPGGKIPMAGVPARAVKPYIAKLLEKSYKVCIAEQMADPKTCKGLVPREICQTYTPGTIAELDLLKGHQNNFIASIFENTRAKKFGLAYADVSTGEFYITELDRSQLDQELYRISASELLVPSSKLKREDHQLESTYEALIKIDFPHTHYDKRFFDFSAAKSNISREFSLKAISKDLEDNYPLAISAAGALLEYIAENQKSLYDANAGKLFDALKTYHVGSYMLLDSSTRRNLEISKGLHTNTRAGSLFSAIDRTNCPLGKRRLQSWLEQPLYDIPAIKNRQHAIKELNEDWGLQRDIYEFLDEMADLNRLAHRVSLESIMPKELVSLKDSLLLVLKISSRMPDFKSNLLARLNSIPDEIHSFISKIEETILDSPSLNLTEGNIFRKGVESELDEYISLMEDSSAWLSDYEAKLREELGVKTLKVSFNKIHGYYIEVSKLNEKFIPENFICKQTLVNNLRYISEELKEFETKALSAESKRNNLEYKMFQDFKSANASLAPTIKMLADVIADLSAILSLSMLAIENNYVCPEIDDSTVLEIEAGRHPVVEQNLGIGEFVENDIFLGSELSDNDSEASLILLTGPNMAGKSTYMRQNALIILLAQVGSFVPAKKARIGLVDRIFTRIGASDDLASGQSTFMVEMNEVANIVNGMSPRSFLVLDEIGRGTSTYDGVSIAWAIAEYIVEKDCPRTIFATHYHELAVLEKYHSGKVANYQMLVSEPDSVKHKIEFLHKVAPGSAGKSYGIEVAKLAGLPSEIISKANSLNRELVKAHAMPSTKKKFVQGASVDIEATPLFQALKNR
ncbi:MAG: DNA mismatch repair protein MutS [Candidatus Caenarcaniphilales bacterium]|nr:DNA mismatch repair protein MutS [Candidatus Caenarcaniphilales bacterium]